MDEAYAGIIISRGRTEGTPVRDMMSLGALGWTEEVGASEHHLEQQSKAKAGHFRTHVHQHATKWQLKVTKEAQEHRKRDPDAEGPKSAEVTEAALCFGQFL